MAAAAADARASLYALFVAYPLVARRAARATAAIRIWPRSLASAIAFFGARRARSTPGGLDWMVGVCRSSRARCSRSCCASCCASSRQGERDLGRLALVAGAALAFVTVAIPLQLEHQWITIGWALEGAALAWLYRRIPHRGLLYRRDGAAGGRVRPAGAQSRRSCIYEPRGAMRIFNWYLYTYLDLRRGDVRRRLVALEDRRSAVAGLPRASALLPGAGVILLFLLLNIEIADFYATGPTITFRFGVTVSQDLTYTIGWLVFGMVLLAAGIYLRNRPARITAVALIAVTTFKCFLYDLARSAGCIASARSSAWRSRWRWCRSRCRSSCWRSRRTRHEDATRSCSPWRSLGAGVGASVLAQTAADSQPTSVQS